jgi:hypothetical protein
MFVSSRANVMQAANAPRDTVRGCDVLLLDLAQCLFDSLPSKTI